MLIPAIITFIVGGTILSCAWVAIRVSESMLSFYDTFNPGKLKANLSIAIKIQEHKLSSGFEDTQCASI